jgi:DNA-binding transcriptional ArsR family regulator
MENTPARTIFEIQAEFCKAMGNPTRLQIIHILRGQPLSVGEIAQITGFGQSLVSRQLSTLRNVGVVEGERRGNEMIYKLADENIGEVCDLVQKVLVAHTQKQAEAFR